MRPCLICTFALALASGTPFRQTLLAAPPVWRIECTAGFFHCYCLLLRRKLPWQRDPPLIECYLPSITISHAKGERLSLDLVLKETGPTEHREHQMYLMAYLLDDEAEVLKIASDPKLLDKKSSGDSKLFLDVLTDQRLVTIIETKVAKRQGFAGQDVLGKYSDGSKAGRDKEDFLKLNSFAFAFTPSYVDLFDKVSKLKNFSKRRPDTESDWQTQDSI